jgi:predicted CXXCH cytochrome family protein
MGLLHVLIVAVAVATGSGPPQQPAAVGRDVCANCHEPLTKAFASSAHGNMAAHQLRGQHAACEACHGAGGVHAESGDPAKIRSFERLATRESAEACLTCHRQDHAMEWAGSEHAMNGVSCTDCHKIHQPRQVAATTSAREAGPGGRQLAPASRGSLIKPQSELCFTCHEQMKGKFFSSSHHPVREGRMSCSSCHDVHGGDRTLRTEERTNDLCYGCHSRHQGPFVFEHAPVEENCMTCHDPHGTVANNMLRQNEPFLCLQCHEMHFHAARVSVATPWTIPSAGSTNPNGIAGFQKGFNTRCTSCHTRIHGSDLPSQGVSGGGKALIR